MIDDTGNFSGARQADDHTDPHDGDETTAGTSIARMIEPTALTPAAMEDRHLIHPDMEDPEHIDVFRELKLGLRSRQRQENPVILITGITRGCGTTFVAKNLATAIAFEEDRTALLLDCNLRRPSLDREFQVDPGAGGLIEFLLRPAIGLPTIIYPTGIPRLRLIPAGRPQRATGEFFASFRMRALVDVLRNRYDDRSLVIDAPPATGSPDARLLAELADVVLLVVGEGMHRADAISDAAKVFPSEKFGGVVFNHVP
jgi:protein-tyrosine kinase